MFAALFFGLAVGNEWYYQYVKASRGRGVTQDLCPTWEYLHRLARGIWWTAEGYFEASTFCFASQCAAFACTSPRATCSTLHLCM